MIKIRTSDDHSAFSFECPECKQNYEAEPYSDSDYVYGHEEFKCYECDTPLEVELTTQIRYSVRVDKL